MPALLQIDAGAADGSARRHAGEAGRQPACAGGRPATMPSGQQRRNRPVISPVWCSWCWRRWPMRSARTTFRRCASVPRDDRFGGAQGTAPRRRRFAGGDPGGVQRTGLSAGIDAAAGHESASAGARRDGAGAACRTGGSAGRCRPRACVFVFGSRGSRCATATTRSSFRSAARPARTGRRGHGPLSLVIGYAPGVKLFWRGQAVDLAPHTKGEVARLVLE
jgi:hypothetical protein